METKAIIVYNYRNLGVVENIAYSRFSEDFLTYDSVGAWRVKKLK